MYIYICVCNGKHTYIYRQAIPGTPGSTSWASMKTHVSDYTQSFCSSCWWHRICPIGYGISPWAFLAASAHSLYCPVQHEANLAVNSEHLRAKSLV